MVILNFYKQGIMKYPSGKKKSHWMPRGFRPLPKNITTLKQFGKWLASLGLTGHISVRGNSKLHHGYYRIFLGHVKKDGKIYGDHRKLDQYLSWNRHLQREKKNKEELDRIFDEALGL